MKTIGLVMIVKNEGRSLEKCLSHIRKLVDEIGNRRKISGTCLLF